MVDTLRQRLRAKRLLTPAEQRDFKPAEHRRFALVDETGFTLVELLVVILIIGILAAIAIPSLVNQQGKGSDTVAKEQVKDAQTVAEALSTENNSSYQNTTLVNLKAAEVALNDTSSATLSVPVLATRTTYSVTSTSNVTGDSYTITRNANGTVTRSCTPGTGNGAPGGCFGNSW